MNISSIIEPKPLLIYSTLIQMLFSWKSIFDTITLFNGSWTFKIVYHKRNINMNARATLLSLNEHQTSLKMKLRILTGFQCRELLGRLKAM